MASWLPFVSSPDGILKLMYNGSFDRFFRYRQLTQALNKQESAKYTFKEKYIDIKPIFCINIIIIIIVIL